MRKKKEKAVAYGMILIVLVIALFIASSDNSLQGKVEVGAIVCEDGTPVSELKLGEPCPGPQCEYEGNKFKLGACVKDKSEKQVFDEIGINGEPTYDEVCCGNVIPTLKLCSEPLKINQCSIRCTEDYECAKDFTLFCNKNIGKCEKKKKYCKKLPTSGAAHAKMNIVFIPGGFSAGDKEEFRTKAAEIYNTLVTLKPFEDYKEFLYGYTVEKFDEDMHYTFDETGAPRFTDSGSAAAQLASVCRRDHTALIVKSEIPGAAYSRFQGRIPIISTANTRFPYTAIHELGHSMGLDDEYSYVPPPDSIPPQSNCDDKLGCPKWSSITGTECIQGCKWTTWYRSSEHSIMEDQHYYDEFNLISQKHIRNVLEGKK